MNKYKEESKYERKNTDDYYSSTLEKVSNITFTPGRIIYYEQLDYE